MTCCCPKVWYWVRSDVEFTGRNWPNYKVPKHEESLLKVGYISTNLRLQIIRISSSFRSIGDIVRHLL